MTPPGTNVEKRWRRARPVLWALVMAVVVGALTWIGILVYVSDQKIPLRGDPATQEQHNVTSSGADTPTKTGTATDTGSQGDGTATGSSSGTASDQGATSQSGNN